VWTSPCSRCPASSRCTRHASLGLTRRTVILRCRSLHGTGRRVRAGQYEPEPDDHRMQGMRVIYKGGVVLDTATLTGLQISANDTLIMHAGKPKAPPDEKPKQLHVAAPPLVRPCHANDETIRAAQEAVRGPSSSRDSPRTTSPRSAGFTRGPGPR
jgi:hypothetical protein